METHSFVRSVAALSFENCFNPYSDRCPVYDLPDAPRLRSAVLFSVLSKAQSQELDAIWIGRDLGYRGGRRTGLALTDDIHIANLAERWGISIDRPTVGNATSERTAAVVWSMLDRIEEKVFLWNLFPLHPHEAGNPFSNRQHNAKERLAGQEILERLVQLLRPNRIVAIGNDAFKAIAGLKLEVPIIPVRHPSYGGQHQFLAQISSLYGLTSNRQVDLFY